MSARERAAELLDEAAAACERLVPSMGVGVLVGTLVGEDDDVLRAACSLIAADPRRYTARGGPSGSSDHALRSVRMVGRHLTSLLDQRAALTPDLAPADLLDALSPLVHALRAGRTFGHAAPDCERAGRERGTRRLTAWLGELPVATRDALLAEITGQIDRAEYAAVAGALGPLIDLLLGLGHPADTTALLRWIGTRAMVVWSVRLVEVVEAAQRAGRDDDVFALALATLRRGTAYDSLPLPDGDPDWPPVNPGEPWADRLLDHLAAASEEGRVAWRVLIPPVAEARRPSLSARRRRAVAAALADLGPEEFAAVMGELLPLFGASRSSHLDADRPADQPMADADTVPDYYNVLMLRALVTALQLCPPSEATARHLGALVDAALRRVPIHGPRCPVLANAAVATLAALDGDAALGQLARLSARLKAKAPLRAVEKALTARAETSGVTRADLDELAVPDYGLTEVGRRVERLGGAIARLDVEGGEVRLRWQDARGRTVASPPAEVRREHPDALAELRGAAKDVGRMLSAQRDRLDRLYLARRSWSAAAWRTRYLDHPLVGTLSRRLVWLVDGVPCCWAGGALRAVDDAEVFVPDDAPVELWHPIGREVAEVLAWRDFLERHGITQPFKQAHREVYPLTDAERATGTYSNRLAAHLLRQHQMHALAGGRGWDDRHRIAADVDERPASLALPAWGLRAAFWCRGVGDEVSDAGAFLYLSSDRVVFHPAEDAAGHEALPLAEVPELVFSEVMRDVDLFVGVASIGNDPDWDPDALAGHRAAAYWHDYGFGELTAAARIRRDLLVRLVPRLAIADRCEVADRFLHVRGDVCSYRIHLGSGNILISPRDAYLCIVPDRSGQARAGEVALPFEGDRTLALILSKAFLLADDSRITDPTILSQLRPAVAARTSEV